MFSMPLWGWSLSYDDLRNTKPKSNKTKAFYDITKITEIEISRSEYWEIETIYVSKGDDFDMFCRENRERKTVTEDVLIKKEEHTIRKWWFKTEKVIERYYEKVKREVNVERDLFWKRLVNLAELNEAKSRERRQKELDSDKAKEEDIVKDKKKDE